MDFSCMQFYKHMGGFFMHSICLPEKLTRKLTHLAGKLLELKGPTGTTWYVGLIKSGDKLVLQPGWHDFASANNISQNDHLVFKFVGESKFEVFIFDPTGCEKGGSLEKEEQEEEQDESLGSIVGVELSNEVHKFVMKEKDEQHEIPGEAESALLNKKKPFSDEEQGESEANSDSIPLEELRKILYKKREVRKIKGETKMQQPNIATKLPSKKLERTEEEDKERSNDLVPIGKLLRTNSLKNKHHMMIHGEKETPLKKRPRRNARNSPPKKQKSKHIQSCHYNYHSKGPWNAEQKYRAQQLASKVQTGNPYFHRVLTKTNLTYPYRMVIPAKFCADHLTRDNLEVILCSADQEKTWFATSYFCSRKQQTLRGPTWEKFVKENNLKLDDICLFELVKTAKRLTFVIHTSRTG